MGFSTAEWRDEAKHAWTQVDELRCVIKELKKQKARTERIFDEYCAKVKAHNKSHYDIPRNKIREAWEWANFTILDGDEETYQSVLRIQRIAALEKLGIVRCEGCGGSGGLSGYSHLHKCDMDADCGRCNGEGFVIGGSDE